MYSRRIHAGTGGGLVSPRNFDIYVCTKTGWINRSSNVNASASCICRGACWFIYKNNRNAELFVAVSVYASCYGSCVLDTAHSKLPANMASNTNNAILTLILKLTSHDQRSPKFTLSMTVFKWYMHSASPAKKIAFWEAIKPEMANPQNMGIMNNYKMSLCCASHRALLLISNVCLLRSL